MSKPQPPPKRTATAQVNVRISAEDRAMLDRICEARSAERLSADPRARAFTITDWILRHIDADAAALDLHHPAAESAPPPPPSAKPAKAPAKRRTTR